MDNTAIRVDHLSKSYRISDSSGGIKYNTLRDDIVNLARPSTYRRKHEELWALKDVSFEVAHGEAIGIVGRNGAGKSTLLKILSRITDPTHGYADVYGRVGSLLEVGTGFHPELTGRENVFLNGAVLGMTRQEIKAKFDEIVQFAQVEKFLDTPVKRFSSGMRVRLAFAVAAHLEPEILVIDEVLAVGDAEFQKRSLAKMEDVAKGGRTVLFVSHNMIAVQALCQRAIWLDEGKIVQDDLANEVVSHYLKSVDTASSQRTWDDVELAPGNESVRLRRVSALPSDTHISAISTRTPMQIEVEYWNLVQKAKLDITLHIYNEQNVLAIGVTTANIKSPKLHRQPMDVGLYRTVCHIPGDLLNSGTYRVSLLIVRNEGVVIYQQADVVSFNVVDSPESRGAWYGKMVGAVRPLLDWSAEYLDDLPTQLIGP